MLSNVTINVTIMILNFFLLKEFVIYYDLLREKINIEKPIYKYVLHMHM